MADRYHPTWYADLIGQAQILTRLRALKEFLALKGGTLGYVLLVGEEGMGKATIAATISNELDVGYQVVSASSLEKVDDFDVIFARLRPKQVLLLENIQRLRRPFLEKLREVMLQNRLTISNFIKLWKRIKRQGGPTAPTRIVEIPQFTLVATCPKRSDCPGELLHQFSLILELQPYSRAELQTIAERIAQGFGVSLDPGAAELLARACDGRPGHLESMLQRLIRPLSKSVVSEEDVLQAFTAFGINARLDKPPNEAHDLQDLSGVDFEKLMSALLNRMGFQAEMTQTTGDGGIDIVAKLDKPVVGGLYLFQCKRFASDNLVGAPTVRDFYGAVTADRAIKGILITTSGFTLQAQEFAHRVGVELIDGGQLQRLLLEYQMF